MLSSRQVDGFLIKMIFLIPHNLRVVANSKRAFDFFFCKKREFFEVVVWARLQAPYSGPSQKFCAGPDARIRLLMPRCSTVYARVQSSNATTSPGLL
jgi:hypothetical protein